MFRDNSFVVPACIEPLILIHISSLFPGEQESHGFRTTAWSPMLLTYSETDPQVFVPGQQVVSLNTPKANISFTTHADATYPFCEPR